MNSPYIHLLKDKIWVIEIVGSTLKLGTNVYKIVECPIEKIKDKPEYNQKVLCYENIFSSKKHKSYYEITLAENTLDYDNEIMFQQNKGMGRFFTNKNKAIIAYINAFKYHLNNSELAEVMFPEIEKYKTLFPQYFI